MNRPAQTAQTLWQEAFLDPPAFDQASSYAPILTLATQPLDLTQDGVLTPERLRKFKAVGAGFTLCYGFERVTENILDSLIALSRERKVLEQMECLQRGEIVNFIAGFESERRAVLHTATRDLFEKNPS